MRRLIIYASLIILALLVGCSSEECDPSTYKVYVNNRTDIYITVDICGSTSLVGPGKAAEYGYGEEALNRTCSIHAFANEKYEQFMQLWREEIRRRRAEPNYSVREFFAWEARTKTEISGTSCTVTLHISSPGGTVVRDSKGQLALSCGD
jgi:hypothetical protein